MAVVGEFGAARAEAKRTEPDQIVFFGETFTIADEVGVVALCDFAEAALSGADTSEMTGMAAMKNFVRDTIAPQDFDRFWQTAGKNKADADLLMAVVARVYEVISGRPTESPSGSAPGPSATSPSSSASSSRRAELGLVPVGDLATLTG